MSLAEDFAEAVRAAAVEAGALIPPEAVHHGWNVAELTCAVDEDGEHWSVGLWGPSGAEVQTLRYAGPHAPGYALHVYGGSHGRIEAGSKEALLTLIAQWISAIWPAAQ